MSNLGTTVGAVMITLQNTLTHIPLEYPSGITLEFDNRGVKRA